MVKRNEKSKRTGRPWQRSGMGTVRCALPVGAWEERGEKYC